MFEAARDAGFEGIFYDNEEYNVHMWQYPGNCKYASTKTASQYQEQWRLRGQQVAQSNSGANGRTSNACI